MGNRIVFLDASTVDYGDIDFSPIEKLGDFTAHDLTAPKDVPARCKNASVVITNKVVFDRAMIGLCPSVKCIAAAATGYNVIDVEFAASRGIPVSNVPGYSTSSVAQITMTFILALASNLMKYNDASLNGAWSASPIFTMGTWPFAEVRGKTLGILGCGAIGSEVARLGQAFGMKAVALAREGERYGNGIERLSLAEIAACSDFVCLHMPLTDYTRGLIDSRFLGMMKPTAFLINMARGSIVDQAALKSALENGVIAGAALDVMVKEPPDRGEPLLEAPNLIVTPHIGWASLESRRRLVDEIAGNIAAFLRGGRRNVVNG